ncbi:MAG: PLP-dependent aspartate aminotransferase family protein [Dongiaceae bacterium]
MPELDIATRVAQALGAHDPATGALVPPLHSATTYARDADYRLPGAWSYGRPHNPTVEAAEAVLRAIEGGGAALLFSSGMAAATAVFQSLKPGDHVVAPKVMYWALRSYLIESLRPWGVAVDLVDMTDLRALAAAIRPGRTRLVWVETPANPTWEVTDIAAAADIAHKAGAVLAVDSTAATPVLTRPLEHGADLVMHSATKYLNGHSDVLAGVLVAARDDALWQRIARTRWEGGAVLGGFEAWLLLRGLRTLVVRVRQASRSAQAIAEHCLGHAGITQVLYPGLGNDPGHAVASRQMSGGFGGMLSIRVRGGRAAALAVAGRLRLFARATSLGGVESLVEHRASIEGPDSPVPADLLRLSVGIEAAGDLIADLDQALARP